MCAAVTLRRCEGGNMVIVDSLIVVGLLAAYALFLVGMGGR